MTCAKTRVVCYIVADDNTVFTGENTCLNTQDICPREPGEDYTKCKTICKQEGHAEEMALKAAGDADLTEATAHISGIGHYCKDCQTKLFAAGVGCLRLMK